MLLAPSYAICLYRTTTESKAQPTKIPDHALGHPSKQY
jgi:hypothetical protein